jgi:DNA-binding LytR/AlgR family response regulator
MSDLPLRAMLVDDEPASRRYLAELLREAGGVDVVASLATLDDALAAFDAQAPDVAFVDLRLVDRPGDTSGLLLARALAARAGAPRLVFATAMPDHALEAFDVGAADYLLKPFSSQRVAQCVERLRAHRTSDGTIRAARSTRLVARDAAGLVFLALEQVLAFEAEERLTYVHHDDGRRSYVDLSLSQWESQLGASVLRTHRNWLVVVDRVESLEKSVGEAVVRVGRELLVPIARDRAARVREVLLDGAVGARR